MSEIDDVTADVEKAYDDAVAKGVVKLARTVAGYFADSFMSDEAKCRQYAIDPILVQLGWRQFDPENWIPEFKIERADGRSGRVDYALCDEGQPRVFVEAKAHGKASYEKAEEQLFSYAAHKGVPLVVLTDGDTWHLYLSMAEGEPQERCFATIQVCDNPESLAELVGVLQVDNVLSGKARQEAETRLKACIERNRALESLPEIWIDFLKSDELVARLIRDVRERTGCAVNADDVRDFLEIIQDESNDPEIEYEDEDDMPDEEDEYEDGDEYEDEEQP